MLEGTDMIDIVLKEAKAEIEHLKIENRKYWDQNAELIFKNAKLRAALDDVSCKVEEIARKALEND